MKLPSRIAARWPTIRYERIFPLARRSRRAARACGTVAGTVEFLIDPVRREVAARRIGRALRMPEWRARGLVRACLISEAIEEAEIVYFMAHTAALATVFPPDDAGPPAADRTIYVTLHFGNPILAYLYLSWWRRLDVTIVGRALTADNPMSDAKQRYGRGRVAWIESVSRPFLEIDGASAPRARELLLDGRSLFAPIDVPGDVVTRANDVDVFGERARFASGMITLARIGGATVQPIVAVSRRHGIVVHRGRPIVPGDDASTHAEVFRELLVFVRRYPGEWWMWPYLAPAADGSERSGSSAVRAAS